jgi:hypothetical protein
MSAEQKNRLYRSVKWLWLLLQALILPLAARHAVSTRVHWPLVLPALLLAFIGAAFLILWLMAQSLLAMARFPLTLRGGLLLVGGTIAQIAFLVGAGGSLSEAAYTMFFTTLAALMALVAIMAALASRQRHRPPLARLAILLALLPAAGLAWALAAPLRLTFSRLSSWRQGFEWLVLALNSGLIFFSLYRFSVFAPLPENDAAYTREWERWAAPTIIILILSATAAIVLAGISSQN